MLVLSRKPNESIKIGDDIEITVVGVEGDKVKLGVKAPKDIEVHRSEVYQKIQEENLAASRVSGKALGALSKVLKQKE